MPNPPKDCFLHNLHHQVKNHQKIWVSHDRKRYYTWDYTHGDVEVFNKRGYHLGSANAKTGTMTKPAVKGRKIDV